MLRTNLASSRALRVCVLGLVTLTAAVIYTSDSAEARRYRHRSVRHNHSQEARESYSPQFSSIIVDGNSGAVLASNNPDGSRHPASLTKIMTLYLLFERLDAGKMKLDTEMEVSEHASEQAPTKLGLRVVSKSLPAPKLLEPGCWVKRPVKTNVPVTLPVLPKRSLWTRRKSPPKRMLCFLWIHEVESVAAIVWLV